MTSYQLLATRLVPRSDIGYNEKNAANQAISKIVSTERARLWRLNRAEHVHFVSHYRGFSHWQTAIKPLFSTPYWTIWHR